MKIYNSLTRNKEEFVPLKKGRVGIYVCGPTVYDEPHIGHARSAYVFDVIRRYLMYKDFKVMFVRNVTDVDDKIIDKANRLVMKNRFIEESDETSGDLAEQTRKIAEKYLKAYHEDMGLLGIAKPDKEPKATEYIPKMVKFIEVLIENDCAYVSDGDVYFNIKKAKNYGKLSNQNIEKMETSVRILPGENKRDPLDFALWKKAKAGEPSWDSPWCKGRPGWHIECSAMGSDILGDEFDIHGGGIDLIFPHHENEIAQSQSAGKGFARLWMHNGLLTIRTEKMAKSLGNFISIKDFLAKYKDADYLKLLFLGTHYRHPVDYTEAKIESMKKEKETLQIFLAETKRVLKKSGMVNQVFEKMSYMFTDSYIQYNGKFIAVMDEDFDAPGAFSVIFECMHHVNKIVDRKNFTKNDYENIAGCRGLIKEATDEIFGLSLEASEVDDIDVKRQIEEREDARRKKDFAMADKIRKKLFEQGIIVEDTKDGPVWRKKL